MKTITPPPSLEIVQKQFEQCAIIKGKLWAGTDS